MHTVYLVSDVLEYTINNNNGGFFNYENCNQTVSHHYLQLEVSKVNETHTHSIIHEIVQIGLHLSNTPQ